MALIRSSTYDEGCTNFTRSSRSSQDFSVDRDNVLIEWFPCSVHWDGNVAQQDVARYIRSKEDILKSLASGMNNSAPHPGYNQQEAPAPAMSQPSAATQPAPPAPPASPAPPSTARETQNSPPEAPKSTTLRPGFLTGGSRAKEVTQKAQRQPSQAIVLDYPDGAMVEFDRFSNGCSALF